MGHKKRNKQIRPHSGAYRGRTSRERSLDRIKGHALVRGLERYGVRVDKAKQRQIVERIKKGKSRLVAKQPLRREIHVVTVEHVKMAVLYSAPDESLVSILPSDHPTLQGVEVADPRMAALRELEL